MKFVMTQALCPEGMALLEGAARTYVADDPDPNHYLDEMADADALIVRIAKCDGNAIAASPRLKVIGRTGVGYDSVDVKAATARGIPVVLTPGANSRSVAEHALALMLALSKNLYEAQTETARGNWEIRGAGKAFELGGKKLGLIGLGAIGRETMALCRGIGMSIAAYDPYLSREQVEALGAEWFPGCEPLLRACDVVSVHVPLTDGTRDMIAMPQLRSMKPTAILINCSRGGIVKEPDLARALDAGVIAGAGIDVFVSEPPEPGAALLKAKNLIYTPHSAAQTREAVVRMAAMCVEGCLAVLRGERWPHVADKAVYDHPRWSGKEQGNEPL